MGEDAHPLVLEGEINGLLDADEQLAAAAMRPSATLNRILSEL